MSGKLLVPKIRFKEFTNAWEQEKLGNFGTSTGGSSIENFFNNNGKYKVISIGSFSEDNTYNDQGLRIDYSPFIKDKILKKDNIVMILNDKSSEAKILGKALLIEKDDEFVYNQRVQKIDINKDRFLSKFIFTLLNSNSREKITLLAQGNTQIYVNWSSISSIEYLIPNLEEQSQISSLFSHLDSLITLHQRKLSSLKNLKNRLLDKMFCDEKSQFPSIRFKEFTNAWEQWKARGILLPYRQKNDKNLTLISYSVSNKEGFVDQKEFFDEGGKAVYADKKNSLIISFDTFAYNPSRINVGSIALFKNTINGLVSPIYEVFKVSANSNPDFIYLWFKSECFNKIVANNSNKSVRDTLNLKQFEDNLLNLPVLQEQNKIAKLFSSLDSLITLHQRKLNSLKNIKNTLLEKMFV
ncbi:restriction endonuclease subunit S [Mycoplasmopsis agalactiae]|uniref:Type I R/M system specificity subunit n=1 Tax=Mycoplasmopsis agalactiae TaxID=2110 RepID=D3VR87_MYCAA|nr:restriction endonuclease subunit S [Mycoplasmopsis agalactiae]CBH40834.1 Type I R/M system specificity subunit [Mycoplasmopsis agalactiae]